MSSSSKKRKKKVKVKSKQNKSKNVSSKTKSTKKRNTKHESEIKSKKQRQKILEIRRIQSRLLLPTITDPKESTQDPKEYKPCIICGPSGVGKRTLLTKIEKSFPNTFGIREQETDEIDAILVDINRIKTQNLIPLLTLINVEATNTLTTSKQWDAFYIFITCEGGLATLRQRMKQRNTETDDEINQQLENADQCFTFLHENHDLFDCVISNNDLEVSTNKLMAQLKEWYGWINDEEHKIDDEDSDDDDTGSVIMLELTESQENEINDLEIAFEEYDEEYYGFIEYDKFLSILKDNGAELSLKQETFLMIALVLVDEGVDYYGFLRMLRHQAAESPDNSLTTMCHQIALDAEDKSIENTTKQPQNDEAKTVKESNTFLEATQSVRSRGMSLVSMPESATVLPSMEKSLNLDGVEINYMMLKNALATINCHPNDANLVFLMNYLALSDVEHDQNIEEKHDAEGVFIDFNYFLSFCQEISNIPVMRWNNPGKIIESVARQTRIIYRSKQRGKRDKLQALQRLENRKKIKKNKNKNNKIKEREAEEKRQRTLRLRQKAKTVSKLKQKQKDDEERLKLNEWINKREKSKKKIKTDEVKKWMQTNNVFMKQLLKELHNNNVTTVHDLKTMNRVKMDKILRKVRSKRFEKVHNDNSRTKIDKLLVSFEKKWKKIAKVSKKKKTK